MLTFRQRLPANEDVATVSLTLALTAEERTRSRYRFSTDEGLAIYLHLPRGTVLRDRDILLSEDGEIRLQILAKPEAVLTIAAPNHFLLLRAAYHLGNRHIPLEIAPTYLRLSSDPVLQAMLEHLGVDIKAETLPFQPETGAYGHSHSD